jgi:hypothetical protein
LKFKGGRSIKGVPNKNGGIVSESDEDEEEG